MYGDLAQGFRGILTACANQTKTTTAWVNHGDRRIVASCQ